MRSEMDKVRDESIIAIASCKDIQDIKTKKDVERFMDYTGMDLIDAIAKGRLNEDELNIVYGYMTTLLSLNKVKNEIEEFSLLESLEDIVGQLQMGKMTDEQVLEVLSNIVNYEEDDNFHYVCPKCNMSDAITYEGPEGNILDKPICLECDL